MQKAGLILTLASRDSGADTGRCGFTWLSTWLGVTDSKSYYYFKTAARLGALTGGPRSTPSSVPRAPSGRASMSPMWQREGGWRSLPSEEGVHEA